MVNFRLNEIDFLNLIEDVFYSYSEPDPLTDYVSCVNLDRVPRTIPIWRVHTDRYVYLASLLSLCVHYVGRLRYCSELLAQRERVSYRRLEEYSEWVGIIDTADSVWKGFGKLWEITVYIKYTSSVKSSWDRHFEIRFYISAPLLWSKSDSVIHHNMEVVKEAVIRLLDFLGYHERFVYEIEMLIVEGSEEVKVGFEEIDSDKIYSQRGEYLGEIPIQYRPFICNPRYLPVCEKWCNGKIRCSYDTAYWILHEYIKNRTYKPDRLPHWLMLERIATGKPMHQTLEETREIVKPFYDAILQAYRYW